MSWNKGNKHCVKFASNSKNFAADITDRTWVHNYDPQTKQQSSPRPKKVEQATLDINTMLVISSGCVGYRSSVTCSSRPIGHTALL